MVFDARHEIRSQQTFHQSGDGWTIGGVGRYAVAMAKRKKKSAAKLATEPPTCNCLLLCDDVLVSRRKNKHTLQGVIGAIGVRQFPAVLGVYVAYLRVSNVYGSQKITVRFEKTRTD